MSLNFRVSLFLRKKRATLRFVLCLGLCVPTTLIAQERTWTFSTPETVDVSGRFSSLAIDEGGNLQIAYVNDADRVKYGFRDAALSKWFTTEVDSRASFTSLALDQQGNPHLCYTQRTMRYATYYEKKWHIDEISPGSGAIAYYCSVGVSPDGIPHVTWYQERTAQDTNFLHMRHAELRDGRWMARTIDEESQTGKWHTMVVDSKGIPHISYDSYVAGQLKYAVWDTDHWSIRPVDARTSSEQPGRGMGNCLVLDAQGRAMISYFEESALKYARQKDNGSWSIETLAPTTKSSTWAGYRSVQALDSNGFPHIVYEDLGTLRHVSWDGKRWQSQTLVRQGSERLRYAALTIGPGDLLYVAYSDPDDGSLKLIIGRPNLPPAAPASRQKVTR
jgi:hypothetical protein